MERNIRDVRDIFGRGDADRRQELRSYDYSPRSRRKFEALDDGWDSRTAQYQYHHQDPKPKKDRHPHDPPLPSRAGKANEKKPHTKKPVDEPSRPASRKDANSRTLTDRDIRHLERHLSMKKTIRKQISRNLAQAFVDGDEPRDRTFTLTRAKVSRSEQNVLDLLKDNEPDSGHCSSADNPNSSDDDCPGPRAPERESGWEDRVAPQQTPLRDEGKFSFWKMFSVKSRGKR